MKINRRTFTKLAAAAPLVAAAPVAALEPHPLRWEDLCDCDSKTSLWCRVHHIAPNWRRNLERGMIEDAPSRQLYRKTLMRGAEPAYGEKKWRRGALENAMPMIQRKVQDGVLWGHFGETGHQLRLHDLTHIVREVEMDGLDIVGYVEFMETEQGKRAHDVYRLRPQDWWLAPVATVAGMHESKAEVTTIDDIIQVDFIKAVDHSDWHENS